MPCVPQTEGGKVGDGTACVGCREAKKKCRVHPSTQHDDLPFESAAEIVIIEQL